MRIVVLAVALSSEVALPCVEEAWSHVEARTRIISLVASV